jgi:UDP-glucose 4-epimerase
MASTSEVYGFNPKECFSEDDDLVFSSTNAVRWCYAVTKLADEHIALAYQHQSTLNVVVSRIFNSIGPNQTNRYGWVVPTFIKQALANEPLTVYGDGTQTRSFCDVRDTAMALEQITSSDIASGEIVNIGKDEEISILDLAKLIISRTKSHSSIQLIPYIQAYGIEFQDIAHRRPVLDKLYHYTSFKFKWDLVHTIDDLIKLELDAAKSLNKQP